MSDITFTMIKPEAVKAKYSGAILTEIEKAGFEIIALKKVHLSNEKAALFYEVHKERPVYSELIDYMSIGPIIAAVLRSENFINFSFLRSTLKCADCGQYLQSSGQLPVFIDTSDASWTSAFLKDFLWTP